VWTTKFKELKTPVAVVISGGNIDPAKFDRAVERWSGGTVER
jgi:threonine dehydratase